MRRPLSLCLFALVASGPALAEITCLAPMEAWRPPAELRAKAAALGWQVLKIRADDGCYHVRATDRAGQAVEGVFDPQNLTLLGQFDKDHDEEGEGDHRAPPHWGGAH